MDICLSAISVQSSSEEYLLAWQRRTAKSPLLRPLTSQGHTVHWCKSATRHVAFAATIRANAWKHVAFASPAELHSLADKAEGLHAQGKLFETSP
eukprot:972602-Amphidinium_carterae.1